MDTISVKQFCLFHNIPDSFIRDLDNYQLIEIIEKDNAQHIHIDEVEKLERLMRLHYQLNVNMEGLDIINNLHEQISLLQKEVDELKRKLAIYSSLP